MFQIAFDRRFRPEIYRLRTTEPVRENALEIEKSLTQKYA